MLESQLNSFGLSISAEENRSLLWLAQELLRWNQKVNLTAITQIEDVLEKHLTDSLSLLPLLRGDERLLDMGSGGGFPGLPLKIVQPGLRVVSVDAVAKKINFQRHIVRHLNLQTFLPLHMRTEDVPLWSGFGQGFDVVVSRAFASLDDFVNHALPCLRPGGKILAMKGPDGADELTAIDGFLRKLDVVCLDCRRLLLPQSKAERLLITLAKG